MKRRQIVKQLTALPAASLAPWAQAAAAKPRAVFEPRWLIHSLAQGRRPAVRRVDLPAGVAPCPAHVLRIT